MKYAEYQIGLLCVPSLHGCRGKVSTPPQDPESKVFARDPVRGGPLVRTRSETLTAPFSRLNFSSVLVLETSISFDPKDLRRDDERTTHLTKNDTR